MTRCDREYQRTVGGRYKTDQHNDSPQNRSTHSTSVTISIPLPLQTCFNRSLYKHIENSRYKS